jgi:Flp pilus assembly protein TadG
MRNLYARRNRYDDQGVSILIIAVSMVFVLGIAGLGIDLASLYVGRNQAQRAADAGALAAAQYLVAGTCTASSGTISADCQAKAKDKAVAITNANLIAGVTPNITTADVTFLETSANDPQVQVIAARDTGHTNPMPTFFVKIFGIYSANVSAKAVAEAYNPSGGPSPSVTQCMKPWLMPNCNWGTLWTAGNGPQNSNCPDPSGTGIDVQFTSTPVPTPQNFNPADAQPVLPASQTRGKLLTIKSSNPALASGPSQFYPVYLPPGSVASQCPSCASGGGGSGPSSGALYRQNIECCNTTAITCGPQAIQPITGNMVGPTAQGVDCLIHEQGGTGQDTMNTSTFEILAGSANPYGLSGPISTSDSVVTVPLYDGTPLCPGGSCPSQVNTVIVGFLQLFIEDESGGNVHARVMNVVGCPASGSNNGSGGTTPIGGGTGSPIPVRLIHE